MGILTSIKEKLFGKSATSAKTTAAASTAPAAAPAAAPVAAAPAAAAPVDVEAVIEALIKEKLAKGEKVGNWRVSIVDFLSVFGMSNSFAARKELAAELNMPDAANYGGTAEQNTWLLKAVMKEIAASGGNVPKEMLK
jgi:3-oxoacyl-ACP reductase-like protein